jgi:hypothetical protein
MQPFHYALPSALPFSLCFNETIIFLQPRGKALPLYDPELVSVVVLRGEESIRE